MNMKIYLLHSVLKKIKFKTYLLNYDGQYLMVHESEEKGR